MKSMLPLTILAVILSSSPTLAADSPKTTEKSAAVMAPSKEDREKMAAAHEKMAACLRSDRDFQECHADLRAQCQATMGNSCPGMGMGPGMGKGMRRGMKR